MKYQVIDAAKPFGELFLIKNFNLDLSQLYLDCPEQAGCSFERTRKR
jgi:hypothetical protein